MFWENLTNILGFTGIHDETVWQDLIFSSILIPLVLFILFKIQFFYLEHRPLSLLFKNISDQKNRVLIFLAQLNPIDNQRQEIFGQKYVIKYLDAKPQAPNNLGSDYRQNIKPLWAEADGISLTRVFNLLGQAGKTENIIIGNLVHDWEEWLSPTFCIGFNPKYDKLSNKCEPIYYNFSNVPPGDISLKKGTKHLNSFLPNDGALIQKTFIKNTKIPVFFLGGLGVFGTKAAGYIFTKHGKDFGKLYGDKAFCAIISTRTDEGEESSQIEEITPRPTNLSKILHPLTYLAFKDKFIDQ